MLEQQKTKTAADKSNTFFVSVALLFYLFILYICGALTDPHFWVK